MNKHKLLFVSYALSLVGLFFYSFTQIDLILTLSRNQLLKNLSTVFQSIGYFNRPLSTYIYLSLLILMYGFYFYFLKLAFEKKIDKKTVWKILLVTCAILVFSYNAFSYDLFNYIFDAKIYTHYHLNPYLHKALDFKGDPMLSFMHWTHRTYPYGPVWLLLTIPLSFAGLNFFLPTMFLFKFLAAASFLGSLYFISKIFHKIAPGREVLGLIFFGLNPLVIIESLVSGHLDIVMIFFTLWAFYMLLNKKHALATLLIILSIGVKFSTVFLLPVFVWVFILHRKKKTIKWNSVWIGSTILMLLTVFLSSIYSGNFQPWYLLLPFSVAVFLADKYYIYLPSFIISLFALFTYIPYLYLGNWNPPVPQILSTVYVLGFLLSVVTAAAHKFKLIPFASKSRV